MLDNKKLQEIRDKILGVTVDRTKYGDLNSTVYLQQIRDAILGVSPARVLGNLAEHIYLQQILNAKRGVADGQFGNLPNSIYLQQIINAYNGVADSQFGSLSENVYLDALINVATGGAVSPLLTSLMAYYKLEDVSDSSGRGHTLTNNGTVTFGPGKVNNAATTNPTGAKYLSCADNADLSAGNSDYTICAWINMTAKASSGNMLITKYDSPSTAEREYALWYSKADARFKFTVATNTTETSVIAATGIDPSLGTWYFLRAWKDKVGQTINIQVNNGVVYSQPHTTVINDSGSAFRIGAYQTSVPASLFHFGLVDEVGIWKRLLTPTEAGALYNGGSGITYPF